MSTSEFYLMNNLFFMKQFDIWKSVQTNRACQFAIIAVAADLGWSDKLENDFIILAERETVLLNSLYYA